MQLVLVPDLSVPGRTRPRITLFPEQKRAQPSHALTRSRSPYLVNPAACAPHLAPQRIGRHDPRLLDLPLDARGGPGAQSDAVQVPVLRPAAGAVVIGPQLGMGSQIGRGLIDPAVQAVFRQVRIDPANVADPGVPQVLRKRVLILRAVCGMMILQHRL